MKTVENSSSSSKNKLICSLCNANKPLSDLLFIKNCSHSFCSRCVAQYISAQVAESAAVIACPVTGCKTGIFEPELCKPMIEREVFDRWCQSLCVSAIENKIYCPLMDCHALLADDRAGGEVFTETVCPHCRRAFRAKCESIWHAGMSCENFRRSGKK